MVMKTLKDEEYVVIKGYKFTVFEIWRDFNVLSYIACLRYPYIRVYRLYDIGSKLLSEVISAVLSRYVTVTTPTPNFQSRPPWHS